MAETLRVPAPADFHVHLRQGTLCSLVTPDVRKGGFKLAYVMVVHPPPSKIPAEIRHLWFSLT
jgi:dihydroorotase